MNDHPSTSESNSQMSRNRSNGNVKFSQLINLKPMWVRAGQDQQVVFRNICRFLPSAWHKLYRCSNHFGKLVSGYGDQAKLNSMVKDLLEEYQETYGPNGMYAAVRQGMVDVAWVWFHCVPDINKMHDKNGASLLHLAAQSGNHNLVLLCLERGASINAKCQPLPHPTGYTALHEACFQGHLNVVKALITRKGNVDALSKNGSTPLLVAAREGHTDICKELVNACAHPDDGGDKGFTPLWVAASGMHLGTVRYLLEQGGARASELCTDFRGSGQDEARATALSEAEFQHAQLNHIIDTCSDHLLKIQQASSAADGPALEALAKDKSDTTRQIQSSREQADVYLAIIDFIKSYLSKSRTVAHSDLVSMHVNLDASSQQISC